jgi:hypothetical protein
MKKTKFITGLLVTVLLALGLVLPAAAQVEPAVVEAKLAPGESMTVAKEVTTPTLLPKADVVISVDLTGSMGGELANLKTEISHIIAALDAASADLNVGIVSHEDYPDYYESCGYAAWYGNHDAGDEPFRVDYAVGSDFAAASAAVVAMSTKDGQDWPESYARVMWESGQDDSGIGYRAGAQKILVMFLDAVPHDCDVLADSSLSTGVDPGRNAAAGDADDIDVQDDAIPSMIHAGVTLLVVYSGDAAYKGVWDHIAVATGGSAVQINDDGTVPGGMSLTDLILGLIKEIKTDVWWNVVECDTGLTVELQPDVYYAVPGETTKQFLEKISVAKDAPQCKTLYALVYFYANSYPKEGDVIGKQEIIIHVLDVEAPKVWCEEGVNPAGKNIPPAGKTTSPGLKGGQNEDAFYKLVAEDNCDPNPEIWVGTDTNPKLFGAFDSGIVIKFTEAKGAAPSQKDIGSSQGKAGAVTWHITLPSDPVVTAIDASGNVATCTSCLVPPRPK